MPSTFSRIGEPGVCVPVFSGDRLYFHLWHAGWAWGALDTEKFLTLSSHPFRAKPMKFLHNVTDISRLCNINFASVKTVHIFLFILSIKNAKIHIHKKNIATQNMLFICLYVILYGCQGIILWMNWKPYSLRFFCYLSFEILPIGLEMTLISLVCWKIPKKLLK